VSGRFIVHSDAAGTVIRVKAVPGASRDSIDGVLGDRLKIRVAAPPEQGRANAAIERLLAAALSVPPRDIEVVAGHTGPEKQVRLRGIRSESVAILAEKGAGRRTESR